MVVGKEWLGLLPNLVGSRMIRKAWQKLKLSPTVRSSSASQPSLPPATSSNPSFDASHAHLVLISLPSHASIIATISTQTAQSVTMAPLYIAPPTPKKDHKGVGIKEYGPDEVHPSDAYHQNITNLLVRPKSAPITQYRAPSPSEDDLTSFNLTFNIMSNGIIDQLHAMAAGQNITVNAAAPYVAPLASTISTVTAGAATANETCDGTISVVSTDSAPARLETKPFAAKGTAVSSMSPTTTVLQFRTQSEYRSLLKRAQRLYGPDARVLIGK